MAFLSDEYLADFEDLTENSDRGILKKVTKEGSSTRKPLEGDTAVVHYVGTYYGGEKHDEQFDSSRDRGEKFEFVIGKGSFVNTLRRCRSCY